MDSFGEDIMGYAAMRDDSDTLPRPDARDRIHDARVSQFSFLVRKIANVQLSDNDVAQLASVLADALNGHDSVSRADLERRLQEAGQPAHKIGELLGAILK